MFILMLSRGIPSKYHPQWGCFEKDQAEALAAYGHKVVVICNDARFKRKRGSLGLHIEEINGVTYYNNVSIPAIFFTKSLGFDFYIKEMIVKLFDKLYGKIENKYGKPDIIYSQFFINTYIGAYLKNKYNIPLVGIEHLSRFNESKIDKNTLKYSKIAFDNSNKLIVVSTSLGEALKKLFNIDYKVVHNLYGPEFGIKPFKIKKTDIFTIIATGSLIHRKGFDVLINALSKINIPKDKWKLNIIGWGEEQKNLEKQIKDYNLQNNISLLGKMDKNQISDQLKKADLFILPSRNENFSVAILEALSMGLPIIATDCGGIRECLNDKNGIIVPVENIDELAKAIEYTYNNYDKFDKEYIFNDCKARFSPEAIAKQLTEIFEETIAEYKRKQK